MTDTQQERIMKLMKKFDRSVSAMWTIKNGVRSNKRVALAEEKREYEKRKQLLYNYLTLIEEELDCLILDD